MLYRELSDICVYYTSADPLHEKYYSILPGNIQISFIFLKRHKCAIVFNIQSSNDDVGATPGLGNVVGMAYRNLCIKTASKEHNLAICVLSGHLMFTFVAAIRHHP